MHKSALSPTFVKKTAKTLAISAGVIAIAGFLILPAVLRPLLEKKIAETIHRKVAIRKVSINPFTLALALKGVTISRRDLSGVMLSFDEFSVNLQLMSLVKRGLIVSSVRLVKPYVNVARNRDLTYDFSDLLVAGAPPPPKEDKPKEPLKFSINNIEVKDGSADFLDAPKSTRHTVRGLNISVPFISNLPYDLTSYVEPFFEATINGNSFVFKGKTRPFDESLETTVDVELKDVNLPYYLAYSPVPLNFKLLSGALDVQAVVAFQQFRDRPPTVSLKGTVALKDIRVADRKKKRLAELTRFSVSFLPSDLMTKTVHLSEISLVGPKIFLERDQQGELGIVKALVPEQQKTGEAAEPAQVRKDEGEKSQLPVVDIDLLSVSNGMVLFTDWQPAAQPDGPEEAAGEPVKLLVDKIAFKGASLSTRKESTGKLELSLNINRKGSLRSSGSIALNPLDLEIALRIGNIELPPFQPYVSQQAEVTLDDGRIALQGTARVRMDDAKGMTASFRGSASLNRLAVSNSRNNDALLTWKQLQIDRIDARTNPLAVKIGSIALNEFSAGIVVEADGLLNLQKIAKKAPSAVSPAEDNAKTTGAPADKPAPPGNGQPPDIAIGQIALSAGNIGFVDHHVKPKYSANLADINGKVTGLSSREDITADLVLAALFDRYAPLSIAGKINPLRKDLLVDVKSDFKDMELGPLTPYSGTYIGRAIEKGKLTLGLRYHVAQKKLDAQNHLFIDQLTLGEKIESPQATSLPVGLAISLLKDRKGEIKFDIPVTGEIDNPEFSVWRIVLKVLGNLLVKAATSPFALLGSMMGGEELGYVEFDQGAAELSEQNRKKLDSLVNALYDRPSLKLEIAGYVDPDKDRAALRENRLKGLISAEKTRELAKKEEAAPAGPVEVTAAEYPTYLKKAYRSGKFSKPRNFLGIAKDLPDAEMEKLLRDSITINDEDLRQLANQRARAVKDQILLSRKIEQERIFLIEPKALLPEQKEKLGNSRVDFSLK